MDELIFLGTGGGRFNTLFQKRATGGIIYKTSEHQIHLDPGPGALLRCKECKVYPFKTDILMATHGHLDHINDLNLMIESVTNATTKKRGTLICPKYLITEKIVTPYHKELLQEVINLEPEQNTGINGLRIKAIKTIHDNRKDGNGYKFYTEKYCLYYTSDTEAYSGFERNLKDVDILIANVIKPGDETTNSHLSTGDLISAIKNSNNKIQLIIITHFGMKMLRTGPESEAKRITEETKIRTIAATDSLTVKLNKFK